MQSRKRASGRGHFHWWVAFVGFAAAAACGGSSRDGPVPPGGQGATGGRAFPVGGTGGTAGRGDTGGKAGGTGGDSMSMGGEAGAPPEPGGPIVEVTSPPAVSDPADGDVIVGADIEVTCEVRQAPGGEPLDESAVSIELLDADGTVVDEVPAVPSGAPDEFFARVVLTNVVENGRIGFRCTASDTSSPALTGSDTVWSLIDRGPEIRLSSPEDESVQARGPVTFEFNVSPSPVVAGDDEAEVDRVTLEVASQDIDVGSPDRDGNYTVPVNLADRDVFTSILSGEQSFTIRARNQRTPDAVERVLSARLIVDGTGPEISVTTPDNGDVIGGQIRVQFTVTDELSPVDESSVRVSIGAVERYYGDSQDNWEKTGDTYTCFFDRVETGTAAFQATVNVNASDKAGNRADAASRMVYLDNRPPVVDLMPPNVREWRDTGTTNECSLSFDPLGTRAPDEFEVFDRWIVPRVLAWERTNDIGQPTLYHATMDEGSVRLFFSTGEPLLEDSDGDGVCDEVNSAARASTQQVQLHAVDPKGDSWWGNGDEMVAPSLADCELANGTEPTRLCTDEASDMTRVIGHEMEMRPPVIFASGGVNEGIDCTGSAWELGSAAREGWICLVARGLDRVGNVGVSRPMRLCSDDLSNDTTPECVSDPLGMTAPSCVDDCLLPPAFGDEPGDLIIVR